MLSFKLNETDGSTIVEVWDIVDDTAQALIPTPTKPKTMSNINRNFFIVIN